MSDNNNLKNNNTDVKKNDGGDNKQNLNAGVKHVEASSVSSTFVKGDNNNINGTPTTTFKKNLSIKTKDIRTPNNNFSKKSDSRISFTPTMTNKSVKELKPRDFLKLRMLGKGDVGKVFLVTPKKSKWRKPGSMEATLNSNEVIKQMSYLARNSPKNSAGANDKGRNSTLPTTPNGSKLPIPTELFAMKVVNKKDVIKRGKAKRVMLERDILSSTNHPFIVTMYLALQTRHRLYFFLQYCPGGEFFRMLRRQPKKRIPEAYAKFYAAEILLAIEYLHLLGFIYRDLKPENILVHMSGHLMLADFDLARLVKHTGKKKAPKIVPRKGKYKGNKRNRGRGNAGIGEARRNGNGTGNAPGRNLFSMCCGGGTGLQPKIEDEAMTVDTESQLNPTNASDRAMSFVGTVEYIAPEVIKNEGYAGTVDWWTFGILMYEMMHGKTPFKGKDTDDTFANIYLGDFDFPKDVDTSNECKSLLRMLLAKDLEDRLSSPSQIRQHAFFKGTNWALLRNEKPPIIPNIEHPLDTRNFRSFNDVVESDEEFIGRNSGTTENSKKKDLFGAKSVNNNSHNKNNNKQSNQNLDTPIKSTDAIGSTIKQNNEGGKKQEQKTNGTEGDKSGSGDESDDEDVIKILTPDVSKRASSTSESFKGFEWKTPRAEDPHWDDINFMARSPKPLSLQKPVFLSRIQSISGEALQYQKNSDAASVENIELDDNSEGKKIRKKEKLSEIIE